MPVLAGVVCASLYPKISCIDVTPVASKRHHIDCAKPLGCRQAERIARMFVDARVQKIYGGTNEIMKLLIARSL